MLTSSCKEKEAPKAGGSFAYRPDIDGLRAVAVLLVVGFHAFPGSIRGGFIGVDIFFVISGFLITSHILQDLKQHRFSFADFYSRRIRRIFPALFTVLAAVLAFGWFALLPDEYRQLGKHIAGGAGFISNLILWKESGYFDIASDLKPLLHLWSLGIEEQYYILFPIFLYGLWKKHYNLLTATILLLLLSFGNNLALYKKNPVADFYFPGSRFWELLAGATLAHLTLYPIKRTWIAAFREKRDQLLHNLIYADQEQKKEKPLWPDLLSILGILLIAFAAYKLTKDHPFPGKWAVLPVLGAVFLIAAGPGAWINKNILSRRLLVWIGLISYPLYLWHWPLLSFARIIEGEVPSRTIRIGLVVLSFVLAALTYLLIERPIRFGGYKKAKVVGLAIAVAIIGLAGLYVKNHKGLPKRTAVASYEKAWIKRKRFEYAIGLSLSWYQGKENWLFLGNAYNNTIAKLIGAINPSLEELKETKEIFSEISRTASANGITVALLVGPDKSSIYPEYLPTWLIPSQKRYVNSFIDELNKIPDLEVYDPTEILRGSKRSGEFLYWRTDTHWNQKGAFVAYTGLLNLLKISPPAVSFKNGPEYAGDLIGISGLKDFPLSVGDNFDFSFMKSPVLVKKDNSNGSVNSFGSAGMVINKNFLSDKCVWILGDSFVEALRPYLNATFKEIHYIGHWQNNLKSLSNEIIQTKRKPGLILIVRVERSF